MVSSTAEIPVESAPRRVGRWARECAQFATLPFIPSQSARLGRLYDIVGTQNLFGEDSLYINLGYWKDRPPTLDEASAGLVRLVGREAGLSRGDVVLDVGCGYGDQDLLWAKEFAPAEIIGVNVAVEQVAIAQARVAELGLSEQIRYVNASAMDLPRTDGSVSKVVALESAFHFPSHRRFFAEAHRVLEPGGRLVTADIVPRGTRVTEAARRVAEAPGLRRLPSVLATGDWLDVKRYRQALLDAGFAHAEVYSIRREVYLPLASYLRKRLRDKDMRRVNPLLRLGFSRLGVRFWSPWMDYIVAVGTKGDA